LLGNAATIGGEHRGQSGEISGTPKIAMSSGPRRTAFLTFGGGKTWPEAARRLQKQAAATGVFSDVFGETSDAFFADNPDFARHKSFIESNARGWGYWIWKPYLILKYMDRLEAGDIIFYLDAGCEILPENRAGFEPLLRHIVSNGNAFFDYSRYAVFNLAFWSKQDLLDQLQQEFGSVDWLRTPKIWAGGFGLMKSDENIAFLRDWLRLATQDDYHLVDDTPSRSPQMYTFFEHRHDQSILSGLKAVYKFPDSQPASDFDYVNIGQDMMEVALAQPFLMSRNATGDSRIEQMKRSPLPAGATTSTHQVANGLTQKHMAMLIKLDLLREDSLCYCGSGKRFTHCHGAFVDLRSSG